MKIAFDFHGVLDTCPSKFKLLMKSLDYDTSVERIILSGPPEEQIVEELENAGYQYDLHYDTIISVVDWLKSRDVPMDQYENGNWYCDDKIWWKSKARICNCHNIDILFDDKLEYKENIKGDMPLFMHVK